MIVKPAIRYLLSAPDAQLIVIVQTVLAAVAAHATIFTTPVPTPTVVQTALDAFMVSLQEAALGGPAQTAIKNARRAELAALMRLLANYVGAIAHGDMSILLLSGYPHQKPNPGPVGPMPKPATPRSRPGSYSGSLIAATVPIYGAGTYNWRLALHSAPTVYLQTVQTTGARVTFTGLTPGQTYDVAVNAVGASGPGDYSENGSTMVV